MKIALEKLRSPEWRAIWRGTQCFSPFNRESDSHLIQIDNPIVVQPERPMVDTSFWDPSLESVQQASRDECLAKHVFRHACLDAYGKAVPVALKKLNGKLTALATDDILPGGLVIPVLCFRDSSMHTPSSKGYHSKDGVFGSVKWKQPVDESSVRDVEINIRCQPEPNANTIFKGRRDATSVCNTFWYIRRSYNVARSNSAIGSFKTKVITSAPMTELKTDSYHHKPGLLEFEVTIPCIVNNEKINAGTKLC